MFALCLFILAVFFGYNQYDAAYEADKCASNISEAQYEAIVERIDRSKDVTFEAYARLSKQMLASQGISNKENAELESGIRRMETLGSREDELASRAERIR